MSMERRIQGVSVLQFIEINELGLFGSRRDDECLKMMCSPQILLKKGLLILLW